MKKIAVYVRTSAGDQNPISQYSMLPTNLQYEVFEDLAVSGVIPFEMRSASKRLWQEIQRGRISKVYVARLDRISRTSSDLIKTIEKFTEHSVPVESMQEAFCTLDANGKMSPIGSLVLHILSSFSNQTFEEIKKKTALGIARAREEGKYKGRKKQSCEDPEVYLRKIRPAKIADLLRAGASIRSICRTIEVSPNSVYKVKQLLEQRKAA